MLTPACLIYFFLYCFIELCFAKQGISTVISRPQKVT